MKYLVDFVLKGCVLNQNPCHMLGDLSRMPKLEDQDDDLRTLGNMVDFGPLVDQKINCWPKSTVG